MVGFLARRELLLSGAALAVGARTAHARSNAGTILGGGKYVMKDDPSKPHFVWCLIDLDRGTKLSIDTTFLGHGLAVDPNAHQRAVVFEKKGPGCCEVDLVKRTVTATIRSPKHRHFYGHGAYSRDGKLLYATETDIRDGRGLITVRDAKTKKELGELPTGGMNPHDCQMIDGGKVLAVTNGGGKVGNDSKLSMPSVTFVELASGKVMERFEIADKKFNTGHLIVTKDRRVITVSAPREGLPNDDLGAVSFQSKSMSRLQLARAPAKVAKRMIGEALSIVIDDKNGVVGVTHPAGSLVTFWKLDSGRFVKHLDVERPRGITKTLDHKFLIVTFGEGNLGLVDPSKLVMATTLGERTTKLAGSHVYAWS